MARYWPLAACYSPRRSPRHASNHASRTFRVAHARASRTRPREKLASRQRARGADAQRGVWSVTVVSLSALSLGTRR